MLTPPHFVDPVYLSICGTDPVGALLLPAVQRGGFNWAMFGGDSVRVFADGSVRPAITDGTSNTVLVGERALGACGGTPGLGGARGGRSRSLPAITDGTSNTILVGERAPGGRGSALGLGGVRGGRSRSLPAIADGTSNTVLVGEQVLGDGSVRFLCDGSVRPGITDGTSNTIVFAERKPSQAMLRPKELDGCFRLLLPARLASMLRGNDLRLRMRHGFSRHGLEVSGAHATQLETARDGRALVTMTARGIIAILIGL